MKALYPIVALLLLQTTLSAADWSQWRGPHGTGVADADNLPTSWDSTKNVAWRIELPSWSGSSPIVSGNRIFVMSPSPQPVVEKKPEPEEPATNQRRRRRPQAQTGSMSGPGGQEIFLFCINRKDGSILWQRETDTGNELKRKHNSSSPSPVTDGEYVWSTTGNGVVSAFDMNGKALWKLDIQETYGRFGHNHGYGSSPLLYKDKLIIEVLHGQHTDDPSYLLALDKKTGKEIWRQERPTDALHESPDSYSTPTLLEHDGKHQIVVNGGDYVTGHSPDTGAELWRSGGLNPDKSRNYRIIASPAVGHGMIFAPTRKNPLLAIRAGGSGDITQSHIEWKWEQAGSPDVPTPICDGEYFYMLDDFGQVTCVDPQNGKALWGPVETGIGRVSASPILADGKMYIISETGETAVLKVGASFELLSINKFESGYTLSTPAASGNQIFIRTGKYLYCLSKG